MNALSSPSFRLALSVGVGGLAALLMWRQLRHLSRPTRVEYDEFGLFHENAHEHGIAYDPPVVRRERVVLSDGRSLSALVWGNEPPQIIFLHGGAQNAHTWDTVALSLASLGRRSLLCIDLPSHGHSDGAARGVNNPAAAAADVAEVIDALAPTALMVVGMSFGGLTSIELSALRPNLARRLVLVDITPGVTRVKAKSVVDFIKGPTSFASFDELLTRTVQYNPTRSVSSLRRGILHNAKQLEDGSWVWRHARFREKDQELDRPTDYSRLWDQLGRVAVPLMLVRGMRPQSMVDGALLPWPCPGPALPRVFDPPPCTTCLLINMPALRVDADEAEVLRRLPRARVERVEEAGHSVQGDQPIALAALLTCFIDEANSKV